jgi:hypothetical protein
MRLVFATARHPPKRLALDSVERLGHGGTMTEIDQIKWKPNDKGTPGRRMPADYIMRKDPNARRDYLEMRSNLGLSHAEAELRIERLSDANFRTVLLAKADKIDLTNEEIEDLDQRPEMWVRLARGFTVEQIFPNLEELGMIRQAGLQ